MNTEQITQFVMPLCVLLIVAIPFGHLARRAALPAVLGELVGGILMGPTIFGRIYPELFNSLIGKHIADSMPLDMFIQFGVLLFMFTAGSEMDLSSAWHNRKPTSLASLMGILLPFGLGMCVGLLFPGEYAAGGKTSTLVYILFMGTAMSISSLPVILKTLMDLDMAGTRIGSVIIGSSAVNDLAGWIIFACLISLNSSHGHSYTAALMSIIKIVLFIGVMALIGKLIVSRLASANIPQGVVLVIIVILLLNCCVGADFLGVHPIFAAFVFGIICKVSQPTRGHQAMDTIAIFAMELFAPVYFVSIGLKLDLIGHFDLTMVLAVLILACVGKIAGSTFGSWVAGMNIRESICVGLGLNARGAMGIMLACCGLENGIINEMVFEAIVIMSMITSILSGPLIKIVYSGQRETSEEEEEHHDFIKELEGNSL